MIPDERVEHPAPGVTVYRTTCHSSFGDFEGERCPRCGINYYDWLIYGDDEVFGLSGAEGGTAGES